ncbi:hypothetical protein Srufu_013900 [Streptomyces libani subsp. rufus]|nr:hypothetical protein Srufu_013900 [Streptomyces libani subsp. rufus]
MALVSPTRTTDTPHREPLLSYNLTTAPDPLKASEENPSTPEERGELIIVGSRRHRTDQPRPLGRTTRGEQPSLAKAANGP